MFTLARTIFKDTRPYMADVFVVRNQLGHYWGKDKRWVDGSNPRSVMRTLHQDEAVFAGRLAKVARNAKLLGELDGVPLEQRTARFRCSMAYLAPGGEPLVVDGACEGRINDVPRGDNGFGYDPVFEPIEGDGRTFSQMSREEKNELSHRARALAALDTALTQSPLPNLP